MREQKGLSKVISGPWNHVTSRPDKLTNKIQRKLHGINRKTGQELFTFWFFGRPNVCLAVVLDKLKRVICYRRLREASLSGERRPQLDCTQKAIFYYVSWIVVSKLKLCYCEVHYTLWCMYVFVVASLFLYLDESIFILNKYTWIVHDQKRLGHRFVWVRVFSKQQYAPRGEPARRRHWSGERPAVREWSRLQLSWFRCMAPLFLHCNLERRRLVHWSTVK